MANVLFNELSANVSMADLADSLRLFADDIRFLNKLKLGKLVFYAGDYAKLTSLFFDENKEFRKLADNLDRESRQLIYYFLGSTLPLIDTAQKHIEQSSNSIVKYFSSYIDLPSRSAVLSFRHQPYWSIWKIVFIEHAAPHQIFSLPHVSSLSMEMLSRSSQMEEFILSFSEMQFENYINIDCLPQSFLSLRYLEEMSLVYEAAKKTDRIGAHAVVGAAVARINGYKARPDVEKLNKDGTKIRHIFYNVGIDKYLSIDIMHGLFEVCSGNGTHLKEIKFSGEKTSGPEADHSIRVR